MFSSELLENPMLLRTTALSVAAIVVVTELGFFQRILDTVGLSVQQWIVCVGVAASIIAVSEMKKVLKIRTMEVTAPGPAPAAST